MEFNKEGLGTLSMKVEFERSGFDYCVSVYERGILALVDIPCSLLSGNELPSVKHLVSVIEKEIALSNKSLDVSEASMIVVEVLEGPMELKLAVFVPIADKVNCEICGCEVSNGCIIEGWCECCNGIRLYMTHRLRLESIVYRKIVKWIIDKMELEEGKDVSWKE